ncbi:hypothetical protein NADFUDRAFT_40783 [Nadsonia fulvescens var. elongata DSM 6958]|uniref:Homeobox domain-containing protein n=1 Tax=Nadsonia fulvescens var. elongata DSM 6958 TaxID=857566 RepID=A0A1E3PQW2_9ASCO|nr:hypothetical protein NADFUDRAFT_40783 [Nadsonia fulvescens var. elongata DSM 6958]
MNRAEKLDPGYPEVALGLVSSSPHNTTQESQSQELLPSFFNLYDNTTNTIFSSSTLSSSNTIDPIINDLESNFDNSKTLNSDSVDGNPKRSKVTPFQLTILEKHFSENQKLIPKTRRIIVQQTGMTEKAVQFWFQNKRAKTKVTSERTKKFGSPNNPSIKKKPLSKNDKSFASYGGDCYDSCSKGDLEFPNSCVPRALDSDSVQSGGNAQPSNIAIEYPDYFNPLAFFDKNYSTSSQVQNVNSKVQVDYPIPISSPVAFSPHEPAMPWTIGPDLTHKSKKDYTNFCNLTPLEHSPHPISSAGSAESEHYNRVEGDIPFPTAIGPTSMFFDNPNYSVANLPTLPVMLQPITFPLTSVCIGTWKRNITPDTAPEHIFYFSPSESLMVYIFFVNQIRFKISYPRSAIEFIQLTSCEPNSEKLIQPVGKLEIRLRNRPSFFIQVSSGSSVWKSSSDFTENKQASYNLQHFLSGPFYLMKSKLVQFLSSVATNNAVSPGWTSSRSPVVLSPNNYNSAIRKVPESFSDTCDGLISSLSQRQEDNMNWSDYFQYHQSGLM